MLSALLVFVLLQVASAASVFSCTGGSVYTVAHPDDSILFQSPTQYTEIQAGLCVTSIFLTSGDAALGMAYATSREAGFEASAAYMAGVADIWTEVNATFGGQPVLVRTLVGAPQIQNVWFRLPDGGMTGDGYYETASMSLERLYFGSITYIVSITGQSRYSMGSLRDALAQIMEARLPREVRTLDYLSEYDSGDHSDHYTAARITRDLMSSAAPQAHLSGYQGYVVANYPENLSSVNFTRKSNAFFVYTPYDSAECQSFALCQAQNRGEASWLKREYVVTNDLATGDLDIPGPVSLPTSPPNIAGKATVTASSSTSDQPVRNAIDGVAGGYLAGGAGNETAEWSSAGGKAGTTITLKWTSSYTITFIALWDRPNTDDQVLGGTFKFSDGTTRTFSSLNNNGDPTLFPVSPAVTANSVIVTFTSVSASTSNVGLSEIAVYGSASGTVPTTSTTSTTKVTTSTTTTTTKPSTTSSTSTSTTSTSSAPTGTPGVNLALLATASASSSASGQGPEKAIDGVVSGYPADSSKEWASNGGAVGTTFKLTWTTAQTMNRVVLYDRPNLADQIAGATLTFDDGSIVSVPSLANDGSATTVNFATKTSKTILLTVTLDTSTSASVGLAEFQVFFVSSGGSQTTSQTTTSSTVTKTTTTSPRTTTTTTTSSTTSSAPPTTTTTTTTTSSTSSSTSSTSTSPGATGTPGVNLALAATASASSSSPGQGPEKAIDGVASGYPADFSKEWASDGGMIGTQFKLTWATAQTMNRIVLYDRPNSADQITAGTLTFEDGSIVTFGTLFNDGSATTVTFATRSSKTVLLTVTDDTSSTAAVGLAEFQVYYDAPGGSSFSSTSTTSSSSTTSSTSSTRSSTSTTSSSSSTSSSSVSTTSTTTSQPSTSVPVTKTTTTSPRTTTTSTSTTSQSSSSTSSAPVATGTGVNLARLAIASASSSASGQPPARAIDGIISGYVASGGGNSSAEWASLNGAVGTTFTLTWSTAQVFNTVVLYDRPNLNDQIAGATLTFDDKSKVTVPALNNNGSATTVTFASKTSKTLLLTVTLDTDTSQSVGLAEIEVFLR